ncbi:MAG: hypothetical protein KDI15_10400 [Thiothrix sp.]|nr:hypothetical protein [Thiothrix sp.]HPE62226.1 LuxR C-terminal-related transcriptional regulator [Thiolinea sp.]
MSDPNLTLATCIEAIGQAHFYPRFFQWMARIACIRQYMVFFVSDECEQAHCCLAHNVSRPELGVRLAERYVDGNYRKDTLLNRLARELLEHPQRPACELLLRGTLPPTYRRRFFNVPDLGGKFAMVVREQSGSGLYYINLYSGHQRQFSTTEIHDLEQAAAVVCALLVRHIRSSPTLPPGSRLQAATLSEQEARVCGLIRAGHSAKSIARQLGVAESSVVTYRRRAYQKLGIRRKSELVDDGIISQPGG